jgi:hypothetical protein
MAHCDPPEYWVYWQGRGFQWGVLPELGNSACPELLAACDVVLELEVRLDIGGELDY